MNTNINGTHYMLAALRELRPHCRFYFAGSSEMFGKVREVPQRESTPFHPRSPYGISKVAGFELTRNYREAYGMFCVSGILFNHEGPRRGFEFVTRKISHTVARIKLGLASELRVGNLDAQRDKGCQDYVKAMYMMLQQPEPDDYVNSLANVIACVNSASGLCGVDLDYRDYVTIDERFQRRPRSINLSETPLKPARLSDRSDVPLRLVKEMVQSDLETQPKPKARAIETGPHPLTPRAIAFALELSTIQLQT